MPMHQNIGANLIN